MSTPPNRIDELLKARAEVELEIEAARRRSQVKLAVLFTDIVGSTTYFEQYGDVAGLAMVSRYAELATGVIVGCGGRAIKTIGDSVMAELPAAADAARAAVEIQRRVLRNNSMLPERERLQLRIGMHFGSCYRQGDDLYGDAVNGAAKVTKRTGPAQILITRPLFDALPSETQFKFNRLGGVALDTGAAAEDVFEVVWTETEAYEEIRHHTTMALKRGDLVLPGQSASDLLQPQPPAPQSSAAERAASSQATPVGTAQIATRYELLGELGKGGMGIVYRARDRETGDLVALKVLRPELAFDDQVMGRFKSEVRVARRITHKNVCRLYDLGRAGDTYYITMEMVEGDSLRQILQRSGAMHPRKGVSIALQICNGLREAHAQGVVHRDLKPENVMIDETGSVKLMDFGIARSSLGIHQTAAGMVIGTPAYMAPEQVRGEQVDQRADIYALGHILYEIFTGSPTFKANTAMEVVFKQIQELPRRPREVQPTVPLHIEAAIIRCLEKDPANRFQTVEELEAALQGSPEQQAALGGAYPTPVPSLQDAGTDATMVATPTGAQTRPTAPAYAPTGVPTSQATVVQTPPPRVATPLPTQAQSATQMASSPAATVTAAPPVAVPPARPKSNANAIAIAAVAIIVLVGIAGGGWWFIRSKMQQVTQAPPTEQAAQTPAQQPAEPGNPPPTESEPAPPASSGSPSPGSTSPSPAPTSGTPAPTPGNAEAPAPSPTPAAPEPTPAPPPAAAPVRPLPSYDFARPLAGHTAAVTSVSFSADGRLLASGSADKTVRIWEIGSASMLKVLKGHSGNVTSVSFSGDNQLIASASLDKTVKLWDAGSGSELATLPKESVPVLVVAFSPNSRLLATATQNGEVKLWDSGGPRGLAAFDAHDGPVHAMAFSPNGGILATAGRDGKVRLWQMTSGNPIRTIAAHEDAVMAVAFSPDGRTLASASEDKTVRLWDASSGRVLQTLTGHEDGVDGLAFSADGRVLASGSADKTIKLWEVSSGKELKTLSGHVFGITGLVASRDGRWLASAASDKSIRLWRRE
jgi:WD40 repeat protein/serine/threonine protein kinase/class 3 adenylate cyclase